MTATLPVAREPRPHRVVDRYQRGWLTATDPCTTYPQLTGRRWTLADLEAERAPLRPVVAMPGEDHEVLVDVLAAARHRAVGTVMAGLYRLSERCYKRDGCDARLIAGRPEAWENHLLPRFAWEVGINMSSARVDPRALTTFERVVGGWIFTPESYVEVGENLTVVLAEVIRPAGEYELVSDQWLRHGALGDEIAHWALSKL